VRFLKLRCKPDLTDESFGTEALREFWRKDLYDDGSSKGLLVRHEQTRHASAKELSLDGVGRSEGGLKLVAQWVRLVGAHDAAMTGLSAERRIYLSSFGSACHRLALKRCGGSLKRS
jgi:hypothetical protein